MHSISIQVLLYLVLHISYLFDLGQYVVTAHGIEHLVQNVLGVLAEQMIQLMGAVGFVIQQRGALQPEKRIMYSGPSLSGNSQQRLPYPIRP